jgi:serine O-acetyltransferase
MSIREDIQTVFDKDPAARTVLEVILCYPGLHAIWMHRISHRLWINKHFFLARFVSHLARFITGVEIHPGAKIGRRFFIDHGMGVVIGETAEIGDDVLMYMGTVLGGTCLDKAKRHPTVEDGVVVGAGSIILGPITVGRSAKVGAGSVVVRPVPPGATIVGVPGRIAAESGCTSIGTDLDHGNLPDPVQRVVSTLMDKQSRLEEQIRSMEKSLPWKEMEIMAARHDREDEIREALRDILASEIGIDLEDLSTIRDLVSHHGRVGMDPGLSFQVGIQASRLADQVRSQVEGVYGDGI